MVQVEVCRDVVPNPLRSFLVLGVTAWWLVGVAVGVATAEAAGGDEAVAKIDGQVLTLADLEEFVAPALDQISRQRHQVLEQGLGQLVDQRLLEAEAERRRIDLADLLELERANQGGPVTDGDIDAWYQSNQARVRQPKEAVAEQIRSYLEHQRTQAARTRLLAGLRQQHQVEVILEPFRVDLSVAPRHHRKGPEDAPITLVEFSDFQCPGCRRINPILDQVRETYGDKVQLVFKQLPLLSIHPQAQKAAEAALCAGDQGQFWAMHDALFANQRAFEVEQLKTRAGELGLDQATFDRCLDEDSHRQTVLDDLAAAQNLGLSSTPSLFVNGRPVDLTQGSPAGQLTNLIDDELRRAGASGAR